MKVGLILGLGICAAATGLALADDPQRAPQRVIVREHASAAFEPGRIDADRDGWVTRAETAAEADRVFAEMDANHDGRLDGDDHRAVFEMHGDGDVMIERRVSRGGDAPAPAATRNETRIERRIVIVRDGEDAEWDEAEAPEPPHPPAPARPPMFVMVIGNGEEFDANGDGALSRDEFRAQQLRFFDASDGNGDGRVRAIVPPEPPAAPEPPQPPAPPRR